MPTTGEKLLFLQRRQLTQLNVPFQSKREKIQIFGLQAQEMGKDEDFLFPILVKKGAAISYEAARDQFRKGLKAAGIENIEKFGLHSMRRGSVTALTQAGVSDHLVQKHMRVVSNSTVRRYATLSQEKLGKISRVVFRASAQQH